MRGKWNVTCLVLSVAATAALLMLGCGLGGDLGGNPKPPITHGDCGTEVSDPNEMVVGCLVDEAGLPVRDFNVRVNTLRLNHFPGYHENAFQVVDSTKTDSAGRFSFRKVEPGEEYYITAHEGLQKSISTFKVNLRKDTVLEPTTLFRNGTIEGILRARQDGMPLSSVLCMVENRLIATGSRDDGRFDLYLPPGRTKLICGVGRTDMIEARADVEVVAGDTTTLDLFLDVLQDEDKVRPQGPTGLSYWYDELTGIVHLSWPSVTPVPGGVLYVLRRTDLSIGSHAYTTFFTSDTFHSDVIPWPKDADGAVRTRPKLILYNLRTTLPSSVTNLSTISVDSQITVMPPRFLGPEVEVKLLGDKTTFLVGDTARIVGTYANPYRKNSHLAWIWDSDGTELKPRLDLLEGAGADTLAYPCTTSGKFGIRFKVTDMSGAAASALQVIEIQSP